MRPRSARVSFEFHDFWHLLEKLGAAAKVLYSDARASDILARCASIPSLATPHLTIRSPSSRSPAGATLASDRSGRMKP